jgi:peptide/bleomycin uptake transporter
VIVWTVIAMVVWYLGGGEWGAALGFGQPAPEDGQIVGIHYFWSPSFRWLYAYYIVAVGIFAAFWFRYSAHRWQVWSIVGSAVILFSTYFGVQIWWP